jgi:hypothetical protein
VHARRIFDALLHVRPERLTLRKAVRPVKVKKMNDLKWNGA